MSESNNYPLLSGFYNAIYKNNKYDKVYSAHEMSQLFDGLIVDGVYLSSKEGDTINKQFAVNALDTPAMKIKVAPGRAWFNGIYVYQDVETEYTISAADTTYDRIDALVIEINMSLDNYDPGPVHTERYSFVKIISGTPAEEPEKPDLSPDLENGIYRYPIAYITVRDNTTSIKSYDIEYTVGIDTPYFAWLGEKLDISLLYSKWKTSLATTLYPFDKWYAAMQRMLGRGDSDYPNIQAELALIHSNDFVNGNIPRVNESFYGFTGDGSTVIFTIPDSVSMKEFSDVLIDGVLVYKYTYNNRVITFEEAPENGAVIKAYYVETVPLDTYTLFFEEVTNE